MKQEYGLVIKNGTLVSSQGTLKADLGIVGEMIAAVGLDLSAERKFDSSQMLSFTSLERY